MPAVNFDKRGSAQALLGAAAGLPREFAGYFACSALALGLDTALYGMGLAAGLALPWAAALGFVAGLVLAYVLSVRWVFRVRRVRQRWAEFAVFAAVGAAGLLLTEGLLWLSVTHYSMQPLIAKLLTAGGVFVFNFVARKTLLFSRQCNKKTAYT